MRYSVSSKPAQKHSASIMQELFENLGIKLSYPLEERLLGRRCESFQMELTRSSCAYHKIWTLAKYHWPIWLLTEEEPITMAKKKDAETPPPEVNPIDYTIDLDSDPELKKCFEMGIQDARVRAKENYEACPEFVELCLKILDTEPLDEDRLNKVIDCYYQGYLTIVQLDIGEEAEQA